MLMLNSNHCPAKVQDIHLYHPIISKLVHIVKPELG